MRLLVIDDTVKEAVQKVVAYAETHIYEMDDLLDLYNNQKSPAGDIAQHVCHIPIGFRVVYCLERQNIGLVKHLSVSVDAPHKMPSIPAVEEIIKLFGFKSELMDCNLSLEEFDKHCIALNVVERA